MNIAIKSSSVEANKKELERFSGSHSKAYKVEDRSVAHYTLGKNTRRLKLIFEQEPELTDVFELFGWSELPDSIKNVIRSDMESYRDELLGLYSTCQQGVRDRRKSISYWVKAWRDGICSEYTAVQSLSATI